MVALAGIERLVDERHQPVDLAEHLQAGALGMARQTFRADEAVIEVVDIGDADLALAAGDDGVHRHADRRHLAAEMGVPDLEGTGVGRRSVLAHGRHDALGEVVLRRGGLRVLAHAFVSPDARPERGGSRESLD